MVDCFQTAASELLRTIPHDGFERLIGYEDIDKRAIEGFSCTPQRGQLDRAPHFRLLHLSNGRLLYA